MLNGTAAKFLVAVLGAVATVLGVYFGTALWEPAVLTVLAALAVYLVPNAPNNN